MNLSNIFASYNYWIISLLMLVGVYGMMAKKNLLKKLMGMNILQVGVILFYLTFSPKRGAVLPVFDEHLGTAVDAYANPLPQALMLTAIVVGVATTGVALALLIRIYQRHGTLEEDEILEKMR